VIGLWYLVSYKLLDPERRFLLPPPHRIVAVAFLDRGNAQVLFQALGLTAAVAMAGLAVAAVLGIGLGVVMSQARWIERAVYPWAVVLQTIPILALVPLIGFWFNLPARRCRPSACSARRPAAAACSCRSRTARLGRRTRRCPAAGRRGSRRGCRS
jgi:ABC-type nitrate/sulfonate/bicarbonate transport system permease component